MLRAGGQRHAAKDRRALRCGCDHPDQDARRFVDIVEVDEPALDLKAQPIRQRRGGAGNAVPVERRRQIGELASLLQDDALKRDDIRIERKVGARHQRRVQPGFDVGILDDVQAEVGQKSIEPVGHHALEQRRLVRHQAIQRLGGDAGAAGHGFGAGRSVSGGGKFVPCGLVDDLTRLVVGAELRTPAVATIGGRFCSSHVFT